VDRAAATKGGWRIWKISKLTVVKDISKMSEKRMQVKMM